MPRVAIVSGFWAQNIGNSFFNIGGMWALQNVFGKENVQFIHDKPSYRTFYDQSKGDPKNYVGIHEMLDIDYLVIQGPALTTNLKSIWGATFRKLKASNIQVIFNGVAFFKYTEKEIKEVKDFLDVYPPHLISTRDEVTFNIIKDWGIPVHNGLDGAFFVPKAFSPLSFKEDYYTFNFDRFPEPSIVLDPKNNEFDYYFEYKNRTWGLSIPKIQQFFSLRGKSQAYLGHLLDRRELPSEIDSHKIIRTEHRYTPHMTRKIYQHPNAFVSDEAFSYLSIYANTSLTLADRVHACVMTLAYGNPAMLFTISPRQALFKRVKADGIREQPTSINLDYLDQEINAQIAFLKHHI